MKKVYKYGTGDEIPEGAVYLTIIVQTEILSYRNDLEKTPLLEHRFGLSEPLAESIVKDRIRTKFLGGRDGHNQNS